MDRLRLAIIGFGHIAQSRHVPVIAAGDAFELVAVASDGPFEAPPRVATFSDHRDLLAAGLGLDAVAICTPPSVRATIAIDALRAGQHVLLEKPVAASLGELALLQRVADAEKRTLFAAWHSHFSRGVEVARSRLAGATLTSLSAVWHEDVERWHPGQSWIWQPKGFGVFDAGSNALSILTRIAPAPLIVRSSQFVVRPGHGMPIAAALKISIGAQDPQFGIDLDWRSKLDRREIDITCADGTTLQLRESGRHLLINGEAVVVEDNQEYPRLYQRFRQLIDTGASDVDVEPLRVIADAFLIASRSAA